jgi:nicotinate-nucleotide--dimethylbenzimidazole phosphoribosyltransferase
MMPAITVIPMPNAAANLAPAEPSRDVQPAAAPSQSPFLAALAAALLAAPRAPQAAAAVATPEQGTPQEADGTSVDGEPQANDPGNGMTAGPAGHTTVPRGGAAPLDPADRAGVVPAAAVAAVATVPAPAVADAKTGAGAIPVARGQGAETGKPTEAASPPPSADRAELPPSEQAARAAKQPDGKPMVASGRVRPTGAENERPAKGVRDGAGRDDADAPLPCADPAPVDDAERRALLQAAYQTYVAAPRAGAGERRVAVSADGAPPRKAALGETGLPVGGAQQRSAARVPPAAGATPGAVAARTPSSTPASAADPNGNPLHDVIVLELETADGPSRPAAHPTTAREPRVDVASTPVAVASQAPSAAAPASTGPRSAAAEPAIAAARQAESHVRGAARPADAPGVRGDSVTQPFRSPAESARDAASTAPAPSRAGTPQHDTEQDSTRSQVPSRVDAPTPALGAGVTAPPAGQAQDAPSRSAPESVHEIRVPVEPPPTPHAPADRITLQLPDDAGGGRIHVSVRAGSVAARIVTPDPTLGRQLAAGLGELQGALARQGFDEVKLAVPAPRAAVPAGAEAAAMMPVASTGAGDPGDAQQRGSGDAGRRPSPEDRSTPYGGREQQGRHQQRSRREREREG